MRPSALIHLLLAGQRSANQGYPGAALFELGPIFQGTAPNEQSLSLAGIRRVEPGRNWTGTDEITALTAKEDAIAALPRIHEMGVGNVIITLGHLGTVISDGSRCEFIPPFSVAAIDTTAAGDAFAGALAVRLAEDASLWEASRFASAAGALAATRSGAQPAMPRRTEIESMLDPNNSPHEREQT